MQFNADDWWPRQPGLGHASTSSLEAGTLVVWNRAPYRVVEVREMELVDWPEKFREAWSECGMPEPGTWQRRPMVVIVRAEEGSPDGKPVHLGCAAHTSWRVLPEHYSVCRLCRELPPCRHVHTEQVMERAAEKMAQQMAILPGCCHACREPISKRQRSFTFPGPNLIRPDLGDHSAIFHTRQQCLGVLRSYDERWAKAEPDRTRLFFCEGTITRHHDGTGECSRDDCTDKGALRGLVGHRGAIWHHPRGTASRESCWCLDSEQNQGATREA